MARERGAANDNYRNLPAPVAEAGKSLLLLPRRITASRRRLPDFLIIGGQRCGTTSLYRYLITHPAVAGSYPGKGVHYFDSHPERSLAWYRAHFPVDRGTGPVTGEGSPYYIFHPLVARRVATALPDVRVIAMLRDPVERAYSHYQQEYARGFEDCKTFEEAVDREPERLAGEHDRLVADPTYASYAHRHHSYLARGEYLGQLVEWHRHLPRDQVLVVHAERFFADPQSVMADVHGFLGLERVPVADARAHNARAYSGMLPATRERLIRHFEEPNRWLYEYLGSDLGWSRLPPVAV